MNFMYVFDSIKGNLPIILNYNFTTILNLHFYNTRSAEQHQMTLPRVNTQIYGIKSIKYQSTHIWNTLVNKFPDIELHKQSKVKDLFSNISWKVISRNYQKNAYLKNESY